MKCSTVLNVATTLTAVTGSVAAASNSDNCPPAAVYIFDHEKVHGFGSNEKDNSVPQLTSEQAQLILAEFAGTSPLYSALSIKDDFPQDFLEKYVTSHNKYFTQQFPEQEFFEAPSDLGEKPATAIVVVNGLPESTFLFNNTDTTEPYATPDFEFHTSPTPSFFRAIIDRMASDVKKVMSSSSIQQTVDKAATVVSDFAHDLEAAALSGLKNAGILSKRHMMMGDGMGHMPCHKDTKKDTVKKTHELVGVAAQRFQDDIVRLRALGQEGILKSGETMFLRIESLDLILQNNHHNKKHYKSAAKKLASVVRQVSSELPENVRLMVIAAPSDACTNQQMHMLKHIPENTSGFSKRDGSSLSTNKKSKKRVTGPFSSVAACESATKKCSGHGSCVKVGSQYNGTHNVPVFGCACKPVVNKKKNGQTSTIRYGGDACQKIDVSVETSMFLWTGVVLVLALVATVKLVFSMDKEPLPGILNIGKRSAASESS